MSFVSKTRTAFRLATTGRFSLLPAIWYNRWRRRRDARTLLPLKTTPVGTPGALEVHLLTSARDVTNLLYTVHSFARHFEAPFALVVFGDRSFGTGEADTVKRLFPQAAVWTKPMRDEVVRDVLHGGNLKYCLEFREKQAAAARLVDSPLISRSQILCVMDTDVLFFRRPIEMERWFLEKSMTPIFNRDPNPHPYMLSLEEARTRWHVDLVPHLNSGLSVIPRNLVNLEQMDRFLAEGQMVARYWAVQTLFALFASRGRVEFLPGNLYNVARTRTEDECIAIHYCGHWISPTRLAMVSAGQPLVLSQLARPRNPG